MQRYGQMQFRPKPATRMIEANSSARNAHTARNAESFKRIGPKKSDGANARSPLIKSIYLQLRPMVLGKRNP